MAKNNNVNKYNNSIPITLGIVLIVILTSIFVSISILINKNNLNYNYISLIPIFFSLCSVIFFNVYRYIFKRWSITVILCIHYFRCIILPYIMLKGGFDAIFDTNNISEDNIVLAVFLVLYELFFVFLAMSLSNSKKMKDREKNGYSSFKTSRVVKILLLAAILFVLLIIIIQPLYKSYFSFFITGDEEKAIFNSIAFHNLTTTTSGVIYAFFSSAVYLLQLLLPILLIKKIYFSIGISDSSKGAIYSLIIVGFFSLIMTPDKSMSIMVAFALILMLYELYTKTINKLLPLLLSIMGSLTFVGLYLKARLESSGNPFNELSQILNAYFGGINNVAVGIRMSNLHPEKFTLINDFLSSIPYVSYFFTELITAPKLFNTAIYSGGERIDQIVPLISQSYLNFGFILAPLLSFIVSSYSIIFENKAHATNNIVKKYLLYFISIVYAVGPVLFNFSILVTMTLNFAVAFFIGNLTSNKKLKGDIEL